MPPRVLRSIVEHGDAEQRAAALQTLAADHSFRLARATYQLLDRRTHQVLTASEPQKLRTIFHAHNSDALPGTVIRTEGQPANQDVAANEAYDGLGATWDFFWTAYRRNSIDDEAMRLDATVHYRVRYNNAFWDGHQMVFGDGDGMLFNRFTIAVDMIGHELAHGVTGDEAQLVYVGQAGALNESISDIFGSLVKQFTNRQTAHEADWIIGAGLLRPNVRGVGLRSLRAPGSAFDDPVLGKDEQPAHMDGFVHTAEDNGGVHINSGIPNHAFYLAATAVGGHAWERAGLIWYETLRDPRIRTTTTFTQFAQLTVINAQRLFGVASVEYNAVVDGWRAVGIASRPAG
jgi:Zn-dependent metalloprotease